VQKAEEWGTRIPIGLLYERQSATFEEECMPLKAFACSAGTRSAECECPDRRVPVERETECWKAEYLGRPFGISVRLHWSWFIIFAYVTWSLAGFYFPDAYPLWNTAARVVAGLVTSLLFFLSVLGHELAHSLVGRSAGIPIDSITLFVLAASPG